MSSSTFGVDERTFSPHAVAESTRAFNEAVAQATAAMPAVAEIPLSELRSAQAGGVLSAAPQRPSSLTARTRVVPGGRLNVPIRVIAHPEPRGVYLHIHGGGWIIGTAEQADPFNIELAEQLGVTVVSVDYRLAPEAPYPAAPDDCEAAALWLVEQAEREFGTSRIIVGGESGGAHLSAVTLLRLRDRHGFTGFAAANLVCGGFDLTLTPSARRWGDQPGLLNTSTLNWFIDNFVPSADRRDPDVSPLFADLEGLPPAFFTVGTEDPLLDDTLFMHARWLASGNTAEIFVGPGGLHGFTVFPTELGVAALERANEFMGRYL